MTTITIERALLEQVQNLLYRVTRWKGENHEGLTDLHDIKEAVKAVLAASATAPAWNNVPTAPGLWMSIEPNDRYDWHKMLRAIDPNLDPSWLDGSRYYGPIPEDAK